MPLFRANIVELSNPLGVTRKLIGATFEGETKEADGSVYADVVIEGLSTEVRPGYYLADINELTCLSCKVRHLWSDSEKGIS